MSSDMDMSSRIGDLARSMHHSGGRPATEESVLEEVTSWAVEFIPAVDDAGISLIRRSGRRHSFDAVAATGENPKCIDELQEKFGVGPCLDSIHTKSTVLVEDYATDTRWPELVEALLERTPVRSSLSMLLYTDQHSIGALNLYSTSEGAFDEVTIAHAESLASHAAVGISVARRDEQFRSALASRDIIGQAKGMIMERYNIDALQAFRLLSKLSQTENIPVTEIAQRIVDTDHPDTH